MSLQLIIVLTTLFIFSTLAQQPTCKDYINGFNVSRVEWFGYPNGSVSLRYGYNLFYNNGTWMDYEAGSLEMIGAYYVDTDNADDTTCYLHLQDAQDIITNQSFVCITYTTTQMSTNINGCNGCYSFAPDPCLKSCNDPTTGSLNSNNLFAFWVNKPIG